MCSNALVLLSGTHAEAAPQYVKHLNNSPFGPLPGAVEFQSFRSKSCILKRSYADYHHLEKGGITLLEGGIT